MKNIPALQIRFTALESPYIFPRNRIQTSFKQTQKLSQIYS